MEEDNAAAALDSIVTEFHSYEDFLDSQITSLDLYYLEVIFRLNCNPGMQCCSAEFVANVKLVTECVYHPVAVSITLF